MHGMPCDVMTLMSDEVASAILAVQGTRRYTRFALPLGPHIYTQIKDFLGLGVPGHLPEGAAVPPEFLEKVGGSWPDEPLAPRSPG